MAPSKTKSAAAPAKKSATKKAGKTPKAEVSKLKEVVPAVEASENEEEEGIEKNETVDPATTAVTPSEDSLLDPEQTLKASRALIKHLATNKKTSSDGKPSLFDADDESSAGNGIFAAEPIWLIITGKKFISDKRQLKPIRIALPNSLLNPTTTTAVLIVKDPQRTYKDLLLPHNAIVQKVVGLSKLRAKYKSFEQRRQLRDSYDLVLGDDRVIPSLRNALGSTFLTSTSKVPIPVNIAGKEGKPPHPQTLENEINKAVTATYAHLTASNSLNIRVGLANFTPEQLAANVVKVVEKAITDRKVVKSGWKGVRSLYIKSSHSTPLPIFVSDELFDESTDVTTAEERAAQVVKIEENKKEREEKRREAKAKKGLKGATSLINGDGTEGTPKKRKAEEPAVEESKTEAKKEEVASPVVKKQKVGKDTAKKVEAPAAEMAELAVKEKKVKAAKTEAPVAEKRTLRSKKSDAQADKKVEKTDKKAKKSKA